jgi:hypothetical protein
MKSTTSNYVSVYTNLYFNAHGQAPRGFGTWWFEFSNGGVDFMQFSFTGSYTEAKNAAKKAAKDNSASVVRVLS